ncbi:MAG: zinc-ribbon domain-containing protein [Anaerovibrio sp.]|uniref:zinc ribbon domain-containing protein n=1 Tax=Anaerovibrio sp. TaxID=1872532 RepID=UPI0025DDD051|nr:zinc-ribbon domain-containing protein [Anaerovibrio sp.]MCR5175439.1 zinc-ribbon domain-containing protein [Anaerovibrio sp.]
MADSKIFHIREGVTIEGIGHEVEMYLRNEEELTVEGMSSPDGYLVQAKESSGWKNLTGLGKALQVQIIPSGDSDVLVNIGIGKWADKVGAAGVGILLFAPLAITAGVGAYMQKQLPDKVFACIEKYIMSGGNSVRRNISFERTDSSKTKCPSCGSMNPKDTKFCSDCGGKLSANCPSCGQDVELGKKFCPHCGSSMVLKTTYKCPSCGAEVEEGKKFCAECGTSLDVLTKDECPSCGELVNKGKKFCPSCGASMSGKKVCKCGEELDQNQKFCSVCGSKVE